MTDRPTLFLVDDHEIARAGARHFLEESFDIVGEADEVDAAIEMIQERSPDIVLLDVRLPGGGGAAIVRAVQKTNLGVKFLAFSASTSRKDVLGLLNAGVDGYVTKATFGPGLPDLVRSALEGGRPISPDVAAYLLDIDEGITEADGIERLTPREGEVVRLIARGYTYKETSSRLGISVKTLENHMHNIFAKLGVAGRHELSALLYESGYLRPEDDPGEDDASELES